MGSPAAVGAADDPSRELLRAYPVLRSSDLDETRELLARTLGEGRLDAEPGAGFVLNSATWGELSVSYASYGPALRMDGTPEEKFFVTVPLAGRTLIRRSEVETVATPDRAFVSTANEHLRTLSDRSASRLFLGIEHRTLAQSLHQMLGHPLSRQIRFDLGLDLTTPAGSGWLALMRLVVGELERGEGLARQPLAVARLQDALLTSLLLAQRHNYSAELLNEPRPVRPKVVQAAIELMEARADLPLTTGEIAAAVTCSVRTLQNGFHQYVGCSPMAYLRDVRLDRVHADLRAADPGQDTVTDAALRWGFLHAGRFAAAYRAKFGESPSQTLRGPVRHSLGIRIRPALDG